MLLKALGIDKDVINKHHYKFVQVRSENPVHVVHENCRCVRHSKGHHHVFIMTITRPKCCLMNISLLHSNLMIA
ncbi:hypothetical protein VIGAN_03271500, partial [Vigna angularis var. angularis]